MDDETPMRLSPLSSLQRRQGGGVMKRRTRPTRFTTTRQREFLEHLALSANVTASAEAIGIDTSQIYRAKRRDPDFAAEWRAALQSAYDRIEGELLERALGGYDRPIVWKGEQTGRIRQQDTTLMLRLMTMHRQEVTVGAAASDAGAARRRIEERLDELAERLLTPLPEGLSAQEHGAGAGRAGDADESGTGSGGDATGEGSGDPPPVEAGLPDAGGAR